MTVKWNTEEVLARVQRGAERGIVRATEMVRNEAISLILDTPKTGRIYRRRSVEHRASAPGEPPASDTGRLVNSGRTEYDLPALAGRVIFSTAYAASLEYGTSRMAPRPYARPALMNKKAAIEEAVAASVRAALGG